MTVVLKTTVARQEGTFLLGAKDERIVVDNLSTEDVYLSFVTGRVATKAGVLLPGKMSWDSGEILPAADRKLYYSSRQPRALLRFRTGKDAINANRISTPALNQSR